MTVLRAIFQMAAASPATSSYIQLLPEAAQRVAWSEAAVPLFQNQRWPVLSEIQSDFLEWTGHVQLNDARRVSNYTLPILNIIYIVYIYIYIWYIFIWIYMKLYEYIGGLLMVDGVIYLIFHHSICSRMSEMVDFSCHGVLTASFSLVSTWDVASREIPSNWKS